MNYYNSLDDITGKTEMCIMEAFTPIILKTVEGCIVDIGIGETTKLFARFAKQYNRKQYSVDSAHGPCESVKTEDITHKNHIIYHGNSADFIQEFDEHPAIVLLDGSHRWRTVLRDAQFFIEKMPPNALMFIHDTCPMEGYYERKIEKSKGRKEMDTYKARHELEKMDSIDILTWRYGCGLTTILKKDPNLPFYRV